MSKRLSINKRPTTRGLSEGGAYSTAVNASS
jgi:hypothetical protein